MKMVEIIYSQNNNSTISCYSMDFSGISKQNAHCCIRGEDACQQIPPEHLRIRSGIGVFHLPTEFVQDFIQSIGCLTLKHPRNLFVGLFL